MNNGIVRIAVVLQWIGQVRQIRRICASQVKPGQATDCIYALQGSKFFFKIAKRTKAPKVQILVFGFFLFFAAIL